MTALPSTEGQITVPGSALSPKKCKRRRCRGKDCDGRHDSTRFETVETRAREQAFELHVQGYPTDAISRALNLSKKTVYSYINREHEERRESFTAHRETRIGILDANLRKVMRKEFAGYEIGKSGNVIIRAALGLADIWGDKAPSKVEAKLTGILSQTSPFGEFAPAQVAEMMGAIMAGTVGELIDRMDQRALEAGAGPVVETIEGELVNVTPEVVE